MFLFAFAPAGLVLSQSVAPVGQISQTPFESTRTCARSKPGRDGYLERASVTHATTHRCSVCRNVDREKWAEKGDRSSASTSLCAL